MRCQKEYNLDYESLWNELQSKIYEMSESARYDGDTSGGAREQQEEYGKAEMADEISDLMDKMVSEAKG